MSDPVFERVASLDRLVHEPSRLSILTALSACKRADFTFLQGLTGLTKGNLSSHLAKLEEGGLVAIEKTFDGKIPKTTATLTPEGLKQIESHWKQLERLRAETKKWKK
jgi:DNA-binding transcriptional ArsR family regulator